jgi:hypothetical protein
MRTKRPEHEPEAVSQPKNKSRELTPWVVKPLFIAARCDPTTGRIVQTMGPYDTAKDAECAVQSAMSDAEEQRWIETHAE